MSDSLWPHGVQNVRPSCPSPTVTDDSNLCPLNQWCHPTISPSVVPFSSRLQSFPASGSFPMSQLFALGGQSIGVSVSTSVLPMNTQDWSPLKRTGSKLRKENVKAVYCHPAYLTYMQSTLCEMLGWDKAQLSSVTQQWIPRTDLL